MEYLTALSIGLLGSLHCVGMCGPIAFALPLNRDSSFAVFLGSLLYNLGRLVSYFSLGVIFGSLGKGIAMAGFQQSLSIAIGVIIIATVLFPMLQIKGINMPQFSIWLGKLKSEMSKRFGSKSYKNLFSIGILNGYLPCGLVYVAIAGASAMASPMEGGLFMVLFGLGTVPLMLSISIFGSQIQKKLLSPLRKFIPVFVILIGGLFILRGMNLGIPYVSPKLESNTEIIKCH